MQDFSLSQFLDAQSFEKGGVELYAHVLRDGTSFVVVPSPSDLSNAFRVDVADVKFHGIEPASGSEESDFKALYHISLRRNAPCLRLQGGVVEEFFFENQEANLTEAATLRASITFQANAEGKLQFNGVERPCLGKSGLSYPTDLTVNVGDKYRRRYSNEFGVWMDYAVLIWGQRGIFIHEGPATLASNQGESAGCIHLDSPHAQEFFNWITGRTRITIQYPW